MGHAKTLVLLILVGCATPLEESADESGVSDGEQGEKPDHDPEDCPGGGGGGADPKPIPAPRDCSNIPDPVECRDCCEWNVDNVWGERCRRIPVTKRSERARCWKDAEDRRGECHRGGLSVITTGAP